MSIIPKEDIERLTKTPEQRLDRMLSDIERAHDTDAATPGRNLRALLDGSPGLKARYLESIERGSLVSIEVLPPDSGLNGSYSAAEKTIEIPLERLERIGSDPDEANMLVFTLGHEIEHAIFREQRNAAYDAFGRDIRDIAMSPGPHDYTEATGALIATQRENEARAHIGGFNALVAHLRSSDPDAGLQEIYKAHPGRMDEFIERTGSSPHFAYALRPGLTLEADMTLRATPANIEAMGQHYFDMPPSETRLGERRNQDYANYYGAYAMKLIERAENAALIYAKAFDPDAPRPEVRIDLDALGLRASLLGTDLALTDPVREREGCDHAHADPAPESRADGSRINAPAPAENALYAQAMRSIDGIAGQLGLSDRHEADNLAAATALQAKQSGMSRVDGVLVGVSGRIYVYEGDPANASVNRAAVDVDRAKLTPAHDSLEAMAESLPPAAQQPPVHQQGLRM